MRAALGQSDILRPPVWRLHRVTSLLWAIGLACLVYALALQIGSGSRLATTVRGTVIFDGRPVGGATVSADGVPQCSAVTGPLGEFTLFGVPVGSVTIVAQQSALRAGYPIEIPERDVVDVGMLPLHRWQSIPGTDAHGDTRELRNLVIIRNGEPQ